MRLVLESALANVEAKVTYKGIVNALSKSRAAAAAIVASITMVHQIKVSDDGPVERQLPPTAAAPADDVVARKEMAGEGISMFDSLSSGINPPDDAPDMPADPKQAHVPLCPRSHTHTPHSRSPLFA